MDKYEEAFNKSECAEARKYGADLIKYIEKHQKTLGISEQYFEEMKHSYLQMEKSVAEEKYAQAKLERVRREAQKAEADYIKHLLEEEKRGRIKWN